MIRLDIFSDPVCPWCFIGKTYLARALEARPEHPFALAFHPFQLNPDMPAEGYARRPYLEAKFGGKEAVDRVHATLAAAGEKAGLKVDWEAVPKVVNTLDAHRLIRWAGIEELQWPVVSALFRAYWQEGRDIGDREVLADIAGACGLDRAMIATLLAGDADSAEVAAEDESARRNGLTGVPTFIIGGRYALSGAQPSETWVSVIDDLAEAARSEAGSAE